MKARKLSLLLALILLSPPISSSAIKFPLGYGNSVAKLYVDPPEIIDPELVPPKAFDVNITIDDVENLYGYEFNMSFDSSILTCVYLVIHDVLGETSYTSETVVSNTKGFAWVKVDYYPPATPLTTFTPEAIVTIHFRVKSVGASVLDLHDTVITDSDGVPITHEVSDGFVMTVIRDVAITDVVPASSWAYEGWLLNITVIANNYGNVSETFNVSAFYNDTLIETITVVDLPPNKEVSLILVWNTSGVEPGNYVLSANASTVPYEFNTANNLYVNGVVELLALTMIRDVAITNVKPEVNWAYEGWLVDITVTAENLGEQNETFNVPAYYDATVISTVTVEDLPPHTAINLTFVLNTTNMNPCDTFTIRAEATLLPYEYNTANNLFVDGTLKIRIVGDVNGDGKIEITDVAIASAAFGSYPGHPRWNPSADINRDGRVDTKDVAMVSANFGKTC